MQAIMEISTVASLFFFTVFVAAQQCIDVDDAQFDLCYEFCVVSAQCNNQCTTGDCLCQGDCLCSYEICDSCCKASGDSEFCDSNAENNMAYCADPNGFDLVPGNQCYVYASITYDASAAFPSSIQTFLAAMDTPVSVDLPTCYVTSSSVPTLTNFFSTTLPSTTGSVSAHTASVATNTNAAFITSTTPVQSSPVQSSPVPQSTTSSTPTPSPTPSSHSTNVGAIAGGVVGGVVAVVGVVLIFLYCCLRRRRQNDQTHSTGPAPPTTNPPTTVPPSGSGPVAGEKPTAIPQHYAVAPHSPSPAFQQAAPWPQAQQAPAHAPIPQAYTGSTMQGEAPFISPPGSPAPTHASTLVPPSSTSSPPPFVVQQPYGQPQYAPPAELGSGAPPRVQSQELEAGSGRFGGM